MSIKDLPSKIKSEWANSVFIVKHKAQKAFRADFFTAVVIIFTAFAGFGLGRLSALEGKKSPIIIEKNLQIYPSLSSDGNDSLNKSQSGLNSKSAQGVLSKSFVASKSGKKYYLPWCGGVSNIKEGNKVWFATETEAKKAGYTPAENCKGL